MNSKSNCLGNEAIEMEFTSDRSIWIPACVTNHLAKTSISLNDAGFYVVLENDGELVIVSDQNMRVIKMGQSVDGGITCHLIDGLTELSFYLRYTIEEQAIRIFATATNESSRDIFLKDAVLLHGKTNSAIEGKTSNVDYSLGDAGSVSDAANRLDAHPLFIDNHTFIGIDWPMASNTVNEQAFCCMQFVGEHLKAGQSFELRPLSIGVSKPGHLPQVFLQHLEKLRGRKSKRSSMYFDWLVHASEGLHEHEYNKLLDFFELLKDEFGIRFDLFSADDGVFETRWATTFDLYRKQHESLFPNGFRRLTERMQELGTACGAWLGPDGFGESKAEEQQRIDTVVSLILEHKIGIIKMDRCVSRPIGDDPYHNERYMRKLERLVAACHEANPDIIIINHRITESPYILMLLDSTLWMGAESYPDCFLYNDDKPRLFTRFAALGRGEPAYYGAYSELLEDHGVCFNGFLEGWREELIVQALGRSLMLSPEIYGTLFLLPDPDYQDLARIMSLAERFRELLAYTTYHSDTGDFIHSDGESTLLCLINDSWESSKRVVRIDKSIGLSQSSEAYAVIRHYPFPDVQTPGLYSSWGGNVDVELSPFQVCVLEIRPVEAMDSLDQLTIHNTPVTVTTLPKGRSDRASINLGQFVKEEPRAEDAVMVEFVRFQICSDPTEAQVIKRNERSQFAEINACRNFFNQKLRQECFGIAENAWDNNPVTAWGDSPHYQNTSNIWRLDLGDDYKVARIEVTLSDMGPGPVLEWEKGRELPRNLRFEVSTDAKEWIGASAELYYRRRSIEPTVVAQKLIADLDHTEQSVRYVRMHMRGILVGDIQIFQLDKDKLQAIPRDTWSGNNLLTARTPTAVFTKSFIVDEAWEGRYAASVVEPPSGAAAWLKQEVAMAWIEAADGRVWPVTDTSPVFPYNAWECHKNRMGHGWTFRLPLTNDMCGIPLVFRIAWFGEESEADRDKIKKDPNVKGYIVSVR